MSSKTFMNLLYGAAGRILRNTTKDFILYLRYDFEPSLWRSPVVEIEEFAADTETILVEFTQCSSWNDVFDIPGRGPGLAVNKYCDRSIYNKPESLDQDLFAYVNKKSPDQELLRTSIDSSRSIKS